MRVNRTESIVAIMLFALAALAGCQKGPEGGVDFVTPTDGMTVPRTVKVVMKVEGMKVRPAGKLVEGTGHHHLIIDGSYVPKGEIVPKDAKHLHFGKGQTEAVVTLTPGDHTLTLQFANGHHESYGKDWSRTIRVHVK
ncbi:MAG: DUF4399 domain-containing protein [Zetaproteobacteria bacterium]|nr:MAG: DUF4399 domain-containing protein [Zetaproteobacteria bacterium]